MTDAFVDWNLNCSNTPELCVIVSEPVPQSSFEPVEAPPEDDYWLAENGHGLLHGWQTSLPVSEETGATPTPVEHADLGTAANRYRMFDHVVKRHQNDRDPASCLDVKYLTGVKGSISSYATRVEVAQEIIDRYLNGPLGTDTAAYWYWKHSQTRSWPRATSSRGDFDGYRECDVTLVRDHIATWAPKRVQDLDASDEVYQELGQALGEIGATGDGGRPDQSTEPDRADVMRE